MKEKDILLSVKNLVVEYTSGKDVIHAVNGVSFDLERGKTLGLVGETGAGKTTIAKSILRILPNPPAKLRSGEIWYDGKDINGMTDEEVRAVRGRKISMVFQDPMTALNPVMRVGDQIAEVIANHEKLSKRAAEEKAAEMLEMVGITRDRFREFPHQFSGGMKQRIVIAIALACNPELLLADEPTSALDVTIQAQVLDMINELKQKQKTSMLLITHDLGIVAETCDDVAVIYGGEVIEYGTIEDIFDDPRHPYTNGLFGALPDLESDVSRLSPIDGLPPDPTLEITGCRFAARCPHVCDDCTQGQIDLIQIGGKHMCRCLHMDKAADRHDALREE